MNWLLGIHCPINRKTLILWPGHIPVSCINFPWSDITGLEEPDEKLLSQFSLDVRIFWLVVDVHGAEVAIDAKAARRGLRKERAICGGNREPRVI